ncbi:hypothetical protein AB1Y20_023715 [Prymnesium parvum]|uniref:Dynein axonemal intermediate chain 4 n=1 Tax=Prymnesium parvum TaxID=97485 RepID=A0AB34JE85_PRYPA
MTEGRDSFSSSLNQSQDARLRKVPAGSRFGRKQQGSIHGASKTAQKPFSQVRGGGGRGGRALMEHASPPIVVRDEYGHDVTPRSLLAGSILVPRPSHELDSVSESQSSNLDSMMGGGALPKSGADSDGEPPSGAKTPELEEAAEAGLLDEGRFYAKKAAADAPVGDKAMSEEELETVVSFELTETHTFWLLEIPGTCVALDSPYAAPVQAANIAYEQLLKKRADMADMYVERGAQTFNGDKKQKEVQTRVEPVSEMGTQVNVWEILDSAEGTEPRSHRQRIVIPPGTLESGFSVPLASESGIGDDGSSQSFSRSNTCTSYLDGGGSTETPPMTAIGEGATSATSLKQSPEVSLRSLHNLPAVMRVVERMVAQNVYHAKHLTYRNIQPRGATRRAGAASAAAPGLERLWGFQCETSDGHNISCVEWNPENRDMLAVGYGEFDFSKQRPGLILFWSLKNPEFPDKIIKMNGNSSGVMALSFSVHHPYLLAAGLYDGTVCIFDVRKQESKPMLESGHGSGGKHTDPVWQLAWVDQGAERGEVLVSISTDGRVTQWNMKKGLEHVPLMNLKRVAAPAKSTKEGAAAAGSEGIISRKASGLCVAFSLKDPNIYLAGTEDGHIHKCSCSYNEQHLDNYFGHAGPVYKLRWSPFCENIFLSCSADWSIKLWNQERSEAIFTFSSATDYVADICWSPDNSSVFASVTGDGRLDIWDISVNTLDPITSVQTNQRLSSVAFSNNSPVIIVGHNNGVVDVYSLTGSLAESTGRTMAQQIRTLERITATVQDGPSIGSANH